MITSARAAGTACLVLVAALVLAACGPSTPSPAASGGSSAQPPSNAATVGKAADDGARTIKVETVNERTRDLTIESPQVGTVMTRILLPPDYSDSTAATFPVLVLIHGFGGGYTDWTTLADGAGITAGANALVVMPDAPTSKPVGGVAQGAGPNGRQVWLPFYGEELLQLLERNWHASDKRAVAGLSLGGYSAMALAATYSDKFLAAASYSGALDLQAAIETNMPNVSPESLAKLQAWVDEARGSDTMTAAQIADGIRKVGLLYVSYGNGHPGLLDPATRTYDSLIEVYCGGGSAVFVKDLEANGTKVVIDAYGDGTHSWGYWSAELQRSLPLLLKAIGATKPEPSAAPGD